MTIVNLRPAKRPIDVQSGLKEFLQTYKTEREWGYLMPETWLTCLKYLHSRSVLPGLKESLEAQQNVNLGPVILKFILTSIACRVKPMEWAMQSRVRELGELFLSNSAMSRSRWFSVIKLSDWVTWHQEWGVFLGCWLRGLLFSAG